MVVVFRVSFYLIATGESGIWKVSIVFVSYGVICSCCLCFTWIPNPFSSEEDYEATDKRLWLQVWDKQLIKWMKEKKRLFQCKYPLLIRTREKNWEEMWLEFFLSLSIGFIYFFFSQGVCLKVFIRNSSHF